MSIFGQVWLWSAAAFVVGVLLTWLFLARPAQARSRHLERRLLAAQSAPAAQPTRTMERDPVSAPVARKEPIAAETPGAEEHHAPPSWLERDSLAGRSPGYQPGSEIDDDSLFEPEEPQSDATTVFNAFGRERDDAAERGALRVGDHEQGDEAAPGFAEAEQGRGALFEQDEAAYRRGPAAGAEQGRGSLFEQDQGAGRGSLFGQEQAGPSEEQPAGLFGRDETATGRGSLFERDEPAAGRGALFEPGQAGSAHERGASAAERASLFEQERAGREGSPEADERSSLFEQGQAGRGAHARDESAAGAGTLFGREEAPEPERGSLFDPDHAPEPQRVPESGSAFTPFAPAEPEPPAYAFGSGEPEQATDEETATETTQVLPKRQPRRSSHAFDPPRPSMRTVERREPIRTEEGGRSGSLFEPTPRDSSVPPGPFGPGSAMPRPGGGKPSEEFTVKASVTALRYCTEDSPQYNRMVAEVWFRTADDAERVGFRPL
ncbi:hypothetical protein GCM10017786_33060 [Amycolatopsis deserti]|uniref:Membrane protein ArfC n=1 Tax=Amycolatopsis deserti TaxID=185696 RepID=A0ABQ3IXF0_9PSEU|nr:hypothetical protein [Amycolatopsis deserti]GHE97678.1 hypothetical protein GCM10017786_33060 [Amycolatopsis deserti]